MQTILGKTGKKRSLLKRFAETGCVATALALALALGTFGGAARADDAAVEKRPVVAANRWAIVLDASRPSASAEEQARVDAAREKFCAELEASGILPDHIFVYTSTAKDEARRPTRATILNVLNALRDVDGVCELYLTESGEDKPYWRDVVDEETGDASCEIQLYLTAPGFTSADGERDWLVPCDASLEKLDDAANDERLVSVDEVKDALTRPLDEDATPFQRTFLAVNFLTINAKTRAVGVGAGAAAPAEVDLKKSVERGWEDDGDDEPTARFQHVRVSTKNERWDAQTVDSFYATMSEGLAGCADLAGNRDGWVGAGELAEYVWANGRDDAVAIAQNGNAVYSLCPSRREWSVPAALYREIEHLLTLPEYQKLRDSAKTRRERLENLKRGDAK